VYKMRFERGEKRGELEKFEGAGEGGYDDRLDDGFRKGTTVTFLPDATIFKDDKGEPNIKFQRERFVQRMDELAYLNPGLVLVLSDERKEHSARVSESESGGGKDIDTTNEDEDEDDDKSAATTTTTTTATAATKLETSLDTSQSVDPITGSLTQTFHHAGGLSSYSKLLCKGKAPLVDKISSVEQMKRMKLPSNVFSSKNAEVLATVLDEDGGGATILADSVRGVGNSDVRVKVALRWSSDVYNELALSFVNNIRTKDGGTHLEGAKAGIAKTINSLKNSMAGIKAGSENIPGEFIREGLTTIVSVSVSNPEFEGQTKGRLGNPEVRAVVSEVVSTEVSCAAR